MFKFLNTLVFIILILNATILLGQSSNEQKAKILFTEINQKRMEHNLDPLIYDSKIAVIAYTHSKYMRLNNVLNHHSFKERFRRAQTIYKINKIGENCHKFWKFRPVIIADDFMNSPGHRANILGDFTHTGIAIVEREDGTDFITQIFVKKITQKD